MVYIDIIFSNDDKVHTEFDFSYWSFIDFKQKILKLSNNRYKTIDDFELFSIKHNEQFTENSYFHYKINTYLILFWTPKDNIAYWNPNCYDLFLH